MFSKIKAYILTKFQDKAALKNLLFGFLYWFVLLLYLELLLHFSAYGLPDLRIFYLLGFTAIYAGILAFLTSLVPKKGHFAVTVIVSIVVVILYGSQMIYRFVFGTLYSVSQVQQGGAAITSFWRELLITMWNNIAWVLALFIPFAALPFVRKWKRDRFAPANLLWRMGILLAVVLLQVALFFCLPIGGTEYFSDHYFYYNDMTTADQATERFGLLTAFRLNLFGGSSGEDDAENDYYIPDPLPTEPVDDEIEPPEYNILDINFDLLNTLTENETHLTINNYVQSISGTQQNEYTGMLSDYNLILICAESFATGAIDPELTPTLYKMSQEGFIFNNYYNTYPNNTTDGEYALCMGLYPDSSRKKEVASFYASRNSYLPFCLGNIFGQQKGIETFGYHNYLGQYYGRNKTHPNMGYTTKFSQQGMKFSTSWPASDLEMMEQTVDDYIGMDQFHAYYMTFSGHMVYSTGSNAMAKRNWKYVKDLDMSGAARCYLACNIELEKALAYLMERLEEAGVADKTAIVLTGDHFPYGLTDKQYSELVGYKIDKFTKYKSSLLFWVGGMEENVEVDAYCCNVDILPTLLNLWGFSYDSRLLAGTDILSGGTHVAVLSDMSFFTDKVWLNADTGEIRYLVPESEMPPGYVDNMIKLIKTKHSISKDILNSAYYNFAFEQGDVKVNWGSWGSWDPPPKKEEKPTETTGATGATGATGTTEPAGGNQGGGNKPSPTSPTGTTGPTDTATDPTDTTPGTEPVQTEPVQTEPVQTEPVETEPVQTEPPAPPQTEAPGPDPNEP